MLSSEVNRESRSSTSPARRGRSRWIGGSIASSAPRIAPGSSQSSVAASGRAKRARMSVVSSLPAMEKSVIVSAAKADSPSYASKSRKKSISVSGSAPNARNEPSSPTVSATGKLSVRGSARGISVRESRVK